MALYKVSGQVITPFGVVTIHSDNIVCEGDPSGAFKEEFIKNVVVTVSGDIVEVNHRGRVFAVLSVPENLPPEVVSSIIIKRVERESVFDVVFEEL